MSFETMRQQTPIADSRERAPGPVFAAAYAPADEEVAGRLMTEAPRPAAKPAGASAYPGTSQLAFGIAPCFA